MNQEIWQQRRDYMNNTSLNISGKLLTGLVELYHEIEKHSHDLAIPYLIVGATARDIVLVHGYGAAIERGTRDVDFGIQVRTWQQFEKLKARLIESGFAPDKEKVHQLTTTDSEGMLWEIDIIPFGLIAGEQQEIAWPPKYEFIMRVLGFAEAYENALSVIIAEDPKITVHVASPAGMLLLKLIAWLERSEDIRPKDAADIYYLTSHYAKIPSVFNDIYDSGYMEQHDFDEHKAGTMKLAEDAAQIARPDTLRYIKERLFAQGDKLDKLALEISRLTHASYNEAENLLVIINKVFQKG